MICKLPRYQVFLRRIKLLYRKERIDEEIKIPVYSAKRETASMVVLEESRASSDRACDGINASRLSEFDRSTISTINHGAIDCLSGKWFLLVNTSKCHDSRIFSSEHN